MQRSRANHSAIYAAPRAGFTAGSLGAGRHGAAGAALSPRLRLTKGLLPPPPSWKPHGHLGLLKELKAALVAPSEVSEEVTLRRNRFHRAWTFKLSLGPYTTPT